MRYIGFFLWRGELNLYNNYSFLVIVFSTRCYVNVIFIVDLGRVQHELPFFPPFQKPSNQIFLTE